MGTISGRARTWEGATRRTTLEAGVFESKIDGAADDLPKSQIAGTARLGDETLVCFVDGTATFRFDSGLLKLRDTNCRADYWCASIDV